VEAALAAAHRKLMSTMSSATARLCPAVLAVLWVCLAAGPGLAAELADETAAVSQQLESRLLAGADPLDPVALDWSSLQAFYGRRGYRPIWVGPEADGRTQQLIEALGASPRDGLDPAPYRLSEIASLAQVASTSGQAELELRASAALLRYVSDVRTGRLALHEIDPELFIRPGNLDRLAILERAAEAPNIERFLHDQAPSNPVYRRLRRVLAEYRDIGARGGWPAVPDGPSLKPGMADPRVGDLRLRLMASGDLTIEGADPTTYDPALVQAVQRFQSRHGLEADGVVGGQTLAALNVPVQQRIEQILINMERWRWMPDDLGDRYILVNLAGFELDVVDDGSTVLDMRVVVGKTYRRTPVFSGRMTYLDFNPYWIVTPSIARKDILPRMQADPGYAKEEGMRVFDGWEEGARELDPQTVDWPSIDAKSLAFKFRQDPGPKNALGRVKFVFPNEFNVYLHDTPKRDLFQRTVRTFSSGCIRVEKPLDLAAYLLQSDPDWTRARIDDVVASGKTMRVVLPEPVAVHLTYSTVWFGEGGTIHFRDDIYGRDALIAQALFGK
jgi:L,D-transpeptidase YcbB